MVDLVKMKAIVWNGEELGAKFDEIEIPEDMKQQVRYMRYGAPVRARYGRSCCCCWRWWLVGCQTWAKQDAHTGPLPAAMHALHLCCAVG